MSASRKYDFYPIFLAHATPLPMPTLDLNEIQLNIIRLLAQEGSRSLYDLSEAKYLPLGEIVAQIQPVEPEESKEGTKEGTKQELYHYPQIHKNVEELEKKGLVKTRMDTSGVRHKRIAELTFTGVVLFLRIFRLESKMERTKSKKVVDIYSHILPFSAEWDRISKIIGEEVTFNRLRETASSFTFIQKVTFELRRLDLKFEGFLRRPIIGSMPIPMPAMASRKNRNKEFSKLLARSTQLLKAYIAYLAVYDIAFLSYLDPEEIKNWIDGLWSEKELAYFEERLIQTNSLFSDERLREFLPKYATLNYFFTGMFMEHLLWRNIETDRFLYQDKITLDY